MQKMTIAEAYRIVENDQMEREEIISSIISYTGATRKAVLRKLGQLETEKTEPETEDSDSPEESQSCQQNKGYNPPPFPFSAIMKDEEDWGAVKDEFDQDEDAKLVLMKENSRLRSLVKKMKIERGSTNLLLEEIADNIEAIRPLPIVYKSEVNPVKKHATLVSLLADFHIGSEEYIPGFNRFNYSVACSRVETYLKKMLSWCDLHRNSYTVDEICLVCLGDLISGDIHDELRRTNEFSCPEQVKKASELLSVIIASVAPHFKKVRVEFIVADNHSRVTEKMQFADGTNSYNYLVGHLAKALTRDIRNVEFNVYPEIQQIIKIQSRRYLIMHGNCVRGGGGQLFPMTGISRKLWRESHLRMNMGEDMHFDKILMGHYHSPIDTPDISVAGCLVSSTGFDASAARHTPACITSFFVSGKHEFDYTPFWLNEGETY